MKEDNILKEEIGLKRISIFIDGSNFYHSIKKILKENEIVNYQKLIDFLVEDRELVSVFYYIASLDINTDLEKYKKHEKFLKKLSEIPSLIIRFCNLKKIKVTSGRFIYVVKGDDVQLAQDLLLGAFDNLYDMAIIVSEDEDFVPVISTLKKRFNKEIINAYLRSSSSYKLRNICNFSIKLNKLVSKFIDKK